MRLGLSLFLIAGLAVPAFLALAQDAPPPAGGGENRCQACHETPETGNQWAVFEQSAHARSFYFDPRVILKTLLTVDNPTHLRRLVKGGMQLLKLETIRAGSRRL